MTLSSKEAYYMEFSACAQEVKFVSMLMGEMTEVKNPSVIYDDNQGAIFLEKSRQVGIRTKHIDICHHFLHDMVEDKDIDIHYIRSEYKPEDIMKKNTSETDFARHIGYQTAQKK